MERDERALRKKRIQRHRFETPQYASRVIGHRIQFYNHQRRHQALDVKTLAEAFALAA